jgi:hypothetical protein
LGGFPGQASCTEWSNGSEKNTGGVGASNEFDSRWTNVFLQFCNRDNVRLYCFEQ